MIRHTNINDCIISPYTLSRQNKVTFFTLIIELINSTSNSCNPLYCKSECLVFSSRVRMTKKFTQQTRTRTAELIWPRVSQFKKTAYYNSYARNSGLLVLSKNIRRGQTNLNSSFQRQLVQGSYRCCPIFQAVLVWSGERSKSMNGFCSHGLSRIENNI